MRRAIIGGLVLALGAHGFTNGQEKAPPQFDATLNVVAVPVFVTDGQGRALAGLTKDDFEITDDGQRVEVVGFQAFDSGDPAVADLLEEAPAARRQFLLLFDLSFSTVSGLVRAQKAAARLRGDEAQALRPRGGGHDLCDPGGEAAPKLQLRPRPAAQGGREPRPASGRSKGRSPRARLRPSRARRRGACAGTRGGQCRGPVCRGPPRDAHPLPADGDDQLRAADPGARWTASACSGGRWAASRAASRSSSFRRASSPRAFPATRERTRWPRRRPCFTAAPGRYVPGAVSARTRCATRWSGRSAPSPPRTRWSTPSTSRASPRRAR